MQQRHCPSTLTRQERRNILDDAKMFFVILESTVSCVTVSNQTVTDEPLFTDITIQILRCTDA